MWLLPFATHLNFLDPQSTDDGKPYGPWRYKQIVKESYIITKNTHTSYADVLAMTPAEREFFIEFLSEDFKKQQEQIDQIKKSKEK
jgi:hypothetical protein